MSGEGIHGMDFVERFETGEDHPKEGGQGGNGEKDEQDMGTDKASHTEPEAGESLASYRVRSCWHVYFPVV